MSRKYNNLNVEVTPVERLTPADIQEVVAVARASFGHEESAAMDQDTIEHIMEAEYISLGRLGGHVIGVAMTRRLERPQAFEWMGGIMHPSYQSGGLMPRLLASQSWRLERDEVVAYTRNPKIAQLLRRMSTEVVPFDNDPSLHELALSMPSAQEIDGVVYHIGRYGEGGLYGDEDPAMLPVQKGGLPFKQQFQELQDVRNTLVIAARLHKRNSI